MRLYADTTLLGVLVPPHLAATVAPLLRDAVIVRARRDALHLPDELLELLAELDAAGKSWRNPGTAVTCGPEPGGTRPRDRSVILPAMTTTDAAAVLDMSDSYVRRLIRDAVLPAHKGPGGAWRIDPDDVAAFQAAREEQE